MNVHEAIRKVGHDEDFEPNIKGKVWRPTDAAPGSERKIETLRQRVELGCPLWHPNDAAFADEETRRRTDRSIESAGKQVVCASFKARKAPAE